MKVALTRKWFCEDGFSVSRLRIQTGERGEISPPLEERVVVEFGMECAGLGGGLGEDFALGVDDEARARIGKMRIAAGAVHADYVSEVLDSAGAEEGGPVARLPAQLQ